MILGKNGELTNADLTRKAFIHELPAEKVVEIANELRREYTALKKQVTAQVDALIEKEGV